MKDIVVIAPHADDETLGCGGTLLRHKQLGDRIHWVLITSMNKDSGYSSQQIKTRNDQIASVKAEYGFSTFNNLGFSPSKLDATPLSEVINSLRSVFEQIRPHTVYTPFEGDAHTDHMVTFKAVNACVKSFRSSSVSRVLAYETISETDSNLSTIGGSFRPNVFCDIGNHLDRKMRIMNIYESELEPFPFPRSLVAIKALAELRGVSARAKAAEAFVLLKEIF